HGPEAVTRSLDGAYRLGLRSRDLQRDISWMAHVVLGGRRTAVGASPPPRAAPVAAAGLLDPPHRDDFLALRRVAPPLDRMRRIALKLWSKRPATGAGPA